MTSNGRVARLTALALATGTLVAAGAGSAGAATTSKTIYTATGGGNVVSLTLNLPVALPTVGSQITQNLVTTGSSVRTSGLTSGPAAVTKALLGSNGNVPVVSSLLDKSVTAEYGKNASVSEGTFPANPLLTGGALQLIGKVTNPDVQGSLPVAYGKSAVVDLKIDAGQNLTAVLNALTAALQKNLTGVVGTLPSGDPAAPVAGVTTTVTDLVNQIVAALPQIPGTDATQAIKDAVAQVTALLQQLPQTLSTKLAASTTDTSLLKIGLIKSEQTVTHEAGVVTSHATNALANVSLLGGLVTLDALTSDATAALGATASQANATGAASLLNLNVDGVLGVQITNQLDEILSSGVLPAAAVDAVNTALAQVTTLLKSALGATLVGPTQGTIVKTADKASAEEAAAHLIVQPAGFAKPIIDLSLVPAVATVEKAQAQVAPQPVQLPAKAGSAPHALAQTGAELPLTGAVAAALMGLAAVARRRRLGGLAE